MKKIFVIILCIVMCVTAAVSSNALFSPVIDTADHSNISTTVLQDWYKDAYKFVTDEFLMSESLAGYKELDDGYEIIYEDFYGDRSITRSEIAVILSRYNGSYDSIDVRVYKTATCPTFVDVPDGQWYTPAAQWAYENGIVNGVGGAYFAPDRTITREEFATMLYRYTEYLEVDTSARVDYSDYADSDSVSEWATDAMSWAVAEGLISGKPGKLLAPQDTITRAEVATVIYRYNNEVKAHRDIWDGQPW
ncbi:MAG: S-layer homology domain-containing protein [Clostridia bacterium]|nr:S-layer homology domain-containing protein [Clostridia bacterium]